MWYERRKGMGFRNLHCFNRALLGKQEWRLLTEPNTLLFKVFKAKCFPRESFLDSQLGNNPSLVWKSIVSSIGVLKQEVL